MTLKPFFGFFGGKYRIAPYYPEPLHAFIIEPFAGAAGYALRYPEHGVVLVERDPAVAAVWRYLVYDARPERILRLPLLPNADARVSDLKGLTDAERLLIGFNIHSGDARPRDKVSNHCRDYRPPWRHKSYRDPKTGWQRPAKPGEKWTWHEGYENFWGEKRRRRIARQLSSIRHWIVEEGDYKKAPDWNATWFIDPPYEGAGKSYPFNKIDRPKLAKWCKGRRGQVIVCESQDAKWLPFKKLGMFKSTPGKKRPNQSAEAIYYVEDV